MGAIAPIDPPRRLLRSVLAFGCAAVLSAGASAFPFRLTEDLRGAWNNSVVVGAAFRARDPDRQLAGFNNADELPGAKGATSVGDDGNLNYRDGDLVTAPLVYSTDLELRFRNRYGIFGRYRAWYDYAGEDREVPHGHYPNRYRPDSNLDDSNYEGYNKFSGSELLDLFTYGNWEIGDAKLTARLGQQSINWGESLLYTGLNAFNPLNFAALARPSIRQDDALVPVNRAYANLITRNGVSLEVFYALAWEGSHLPACGSLAQPVDVLIDNACAAATSAAPLSDREQVDFTLPDGGQPYLVPRTRQSSPGSGGQYGIAARYFVEPLDTEFGVFYVNYNAVNPVLDLTQCEHGWEGCSSGDGLELSLKYPQGVQAMAVTAATGVRNAALTAELSHFRDLPVQRNFPELIEGATRNRGIYAQRMREAGPGSLFSGGWKADRTQLLLGSVVDLESTFGLADTTLAAEVSGQWLQDLPGTGEERIGRNGNWGAARAPDGICQPLVQATQGGCRTEGFATGFNWGYRLLLTMTLPRPARGVDLLPRLGWNHDVDGYAVDGTLVEGRQVLSLGLRVVYQRAIFLDLGRSWVRSTTDYDGLRDKDLYTITAGVAF